jgi:hypothetical protein
MTDPAWIEAYSFEKVGVTGSREGPVTEAQSDTAADLLQYLYAYTAAAELHHGDCVGVDEWAATKFGDLYWIVCHPPTDDRLRAFVDSDVVEDPDPYLTRNRSIVEDCDLIVAVPADDSRAGGTWYTIRYARMRGTDLVIVYPDGSALIDAEGLRWTPTFSNR